MKIFGYLDDGLRIYYHWFDFIGNTSIRKIVAGLILLIILWIASKFIRGSR